MSEDQMSQLAIRVQEIKSRKPVRYPEDLKVKILGLYKISRQKNKLLRFLKLNHSTLQVWRRNCNSLADQNSNRKSQTSTFKAVAVVRSVDLKNIRVVLPNGICFENCSEEFLFKVLSNDF